MNQTFSPPNHPDRPLLQSFFVGKIEDESLLEQIESHLEDCPSCNEQLRLMEQAPESDELLHHLQQARPIAGETRFPESRTRFDQKALDLGFLASAEGDDEIGRLAGYRVLEVIGVGGMGIVFRAEDVQLQRQVALKVIRPEVAIDQTAKTRFLREARAVAAIEHENIVSIYQVGEDRDVPFIAMQYLRGESLQTRLRREGRLDEAAAMRLGQEVAAGLSAAHRQNLIHRDIKPDNLWIEADTNRAKILDFGLVHSDADQDLTADGLLLGTPRYMAPEQARSEQADHRCDLFSLGCVLYHALTGRGPFTGKNMPETLMSVCYEEPASVASLRPEIDADFAKLIARLLSKAPDRRPQSANEVVNALSGRDQPVLHRSKAKRSTPGRWLAVGGGITLGIMLILGAVYFPKSPTDDTEEREKAETSQAQDSDTPPKKPQPIPLSPNEFKLAKTLSSKVGRPSQGTPLAISGDGKVVACGGDNGVQTWSLPDCEPMMHVKNAGATHVALSSDGKLLASTHLSTDSLRTDSIVLRDSSTGKQLDVVSMPGTLVASLQFSPDGKWLAIGGLNYVGVWHVEIKGEMRIYENDGYHVGLCFTPDSQSLFLGGRRSFWNFTTDEFGKLDIPPPAFHRIAFSPNGKTLAVHQLGSGDEVKLLTLDDNRVAGVTRLVGHTDSVMSLSFLPGNRHLVSGSQDGSIRIWDYQTQKEVARREGLRHIANHVLPLPNGRYAVSYGCFFRGEKATDDPTAWKVHLWELPKNVWPETP